MGASDALKAGSKASGTNRRSGGGGASSQENVFEYTDSLMEKLGTPEMLI